MAKTRASNSNAQPAVALTIEEANSSENRARSRGFITGGHVVMKKNEIGHVKGIYKVISIGHHVELVQQDVFQDPPSLMTVKTTLADFFKQWSQ